VDLPLHSSTRIHTFVVDFVARAASTRCLLLPRASAPPLPPLHLPTAHHTAACTANLQPPARAFFGLSLRARKLRACFRHAAPPPRTLPLCWRNRSRINAATCTRLACVRSAAPTAAHCARRAAPLPYALFALGSRACASTPASPPHAAAWFYGGYLPALHSKPLCLSYTCLDVLPLPALFTCEHAARFGSCYALLRSFHRPLKTSSPCALPARLRFYAHPRTPSAHHCARCTTPLHFTAMLCPRGLVLYRLLPLPRAYRTRTGWLVCAPHWQQRRFARGGR